MQITNSGLYTDDGYVDLSISTDSGAYWNVCPNYITKKVDSVYYAANGGTYTLPSIQVGEMGIWSGVIVNNRKSYSSSSSAILNVKLPSDGNFLCSNSAMFPLDSTFISLYYSDTIATQDTVKSVETFRLDFTGVSSKNLCTRGQVTSTTADWSQEIWTYDSSENSYGLAGTYNFSTSTPLDTRGMKFFYNSAGSTLKELRYATENNYDYYYQCFIGRFFYYRIS